MTLEKTRLSSKGQIIIPSAIRQAHGWHPGLEFTVEDREDGIVLRPCKRFGDTQLSDVVGCLGYDGPRKTLRDMEAGIAEGARKRT
jgi:AbrB family looped-hinge helix DNA binding protein